MAIRHLLFDADGVLQYPTTPWQDGLHARLALDDAAQAAALLADIFAAETAVIEYDDGFVAQLQGVLQKWGRGQLVAETLEVLHAIEIRHDIMQIVQTLRRAGMPCHLGSNQQALRARHMSETLRYRHLFDREFYSCFLGAAKPQVRFFEKVLAQLGCEASAALFIDDREENVAGARQAGLHALHFLGEHGPQALQRHLAAFGISM
jgi:putative hydrolase of the HAD superfamily